VFVQSIGVSNAGSVEAVTAAPTIEVDAGATPLTDQYARFACMEEARLAAWIAASERLLATPVLEKASACIFAMPRSPTETTISATRTSMRLKPRALVLI
jgi:hypothetical protein